MGSSSHFAGTQCSADPHASFLDTAPALRRMQKHPPKNIIKNNSNATLIPATPGRTCALLRTAAGAGRQLQPVPGLQKHQLHLPWVSMSLLHGCCLHTGKKAKNWENAFCCKSSKSVSLIPSPESCKFHELFLVLPWPKPSTPPLYPARAAWEGDLGTAGTGSAPGEFLEPLWEAASSLVISHTVSNRVSSVSAWTSYPPRLALRGTFGERISRKGVTTGLMQQQESPGRGLF